MWTLTHNLHLLHCVKIKNIKNVDLNKNVLNELFQFTLAQNIIFESKQIICIIY